MRKFLSILPVVLFSVAVFAAIWLYGAMSARLGLSPYPQINQLYLDLKAVHYSNNFHRATYDFAGARAPLPDQMAPGLTLITTMLPDHDWEPGVKLMDADGATAHEWRLNMDAIFPDRTIAASPIHGAHLFSNGDLLFNLSYVGMAKVDRCGKLIWATAEGRAHHSISPTEDGFFWAPGLIPRQDNAEDRAYLQKVGGLHPPVYDDLFVKFSADGEVVQSISALEVLHQNGLMNLLFRNGSRGPGGGTDPGYHGDVLHLNDVEALPPSMADSYPLFEAGDLVVSLRQLSTVLVLDPETMKVKWLATEPLILQHDADFIGGGKIGVFNNNNDGTDRGTFLGGSQIVIFEPHTGRQEIAYPTDQSPPFYTAYAGKWQLLPNGNYLMVESRSGRAVEANPEGETVWEWISERMDGTHVPEVLEATRYDLDPETVASWTCGG